MDMNMGIVGLQVNMNMNAKDVFRNMDMNGRRDVVNAWFWSSSTFQVAASKQ
jgi:hypothetical protein